MPDKDYLLLISNYDCQRFTVMKRLRIGCSHNMQYPRKSGLRTVYRNKPIFVWKYRNRTTTIRRYTAKTVPVTHTHAPLSWTTTFVTTTFLQAQLCLMDQRNHVIRVAISAGTEMLYFISLVYVTHRSLFSQRGERCHVITIQALYKHHISCS